MLRPIELPAPALEDLFAPLDDHLAIRSVLAGASPEGRVWADDAVRPSVGLVRVGHRLYLAGDPASEEAPWGVLAAFEQFTVLPAEHSLLLHYGPIAWEPLLSRHLASLEPLRPARQYYEWRAAEPLTDLGPLAEGYAARAVDADLLAHTTLGRRDELVEELCSERASVDEFLARSFGLCLLCQDSVAGWCLSEYNLGERCEVGIATLDEHQRRGLGAWLARTFLHQTYERGVRRVGWHCWADNVASGRTALRAGLTLAGASTVFWSWSNVARNRAARGHLALEAGRFAEGLEWHTRALAPGVSAIGYAPGWAAFEAACCAAELGFETRAWVLLSQARMMGFHVRAAYEQSPHLWALRSAPAWRSLVDSLG